MRFLHKGRNEKGAGSIQCCALASHGKRPWNILIWWPKVDLEVDLVWWTPVRESLGQKCYKSRTLQWFSFNAIGLCLYIFVIDRPLSLYVIMRFKRPCQARWRWRSSEHIGWYDLASIIRVQETLQARYYHQTTFLQLNTTVPFQPSVQSHIMAEKTDCFKIHLNSKENLSDFSETKIFKIVNTWS